MKSAGESATLHFEFEDEIFSEEFDVDFDLDFSPLGSIQTLGDPQVSIGGSVGFSIEFGVDLSAEPNGQAGITEDTALTDLRGIDELSDLIELRPSITGRFVAGEAEVVLNDPDEPEDVAISIDLGQVTMDPDATLVFETATLPRIQADSLVGDLMTLVAPDGLLIQINQDDIGRRTTGDLQNQALQIVREDRTNVNDNGTPGDPSDD